MRKSHPETFFRRATSVLLILALVIPLVPVRQVSALSTLPTTIGYEGQLTDTSNEPIDDTFVMIVSLYDDDNSDGTADDIRYTETFSSVTTVNGYFQLQIGTDTTPDFIDIDDNGTNDGGNTLIDLSFEVPYLVELTVDGTTLSPMADINTVTYSVVSRRTYGVNNGGAAPVIAGTEETGDIFYDTTGGTTGLYIYDGLAWQQIGGGGGGDITSVGDVASGAAFDGTAGNVLQFEGATADGNEISLAGADATGDQTITLPDASGVILLSVGLSGTANSFFGINNGFEFEGSTADGNETQLIAADATGDNTVTIPDETGTLVLDSTIADLAFVQNGNSFGATATLGTNDNFDLNIETNGTTRATVQSDGDFAVDTNTLFVDAANNMIGVGTITPSFKLELAGTATTADRKIGVNGTQVVYLPDQAGTAFDGSLFLGNGGASLSHVAGADGQYNTGVGIRSLLSLTTGFDNTAVGTESMRSTTTGTNNSSLGYQSLYSNDTGFENVALGVSSLFTNTSGERNVAVGANTLLLNSTGDENVAIGYEALNQATGSFNVAVGRDAGADLTSGVNNTFLGYGAGLGISTGNSNTIIGSNIFGLAAGLSGNIIIGDGNGNQRINVDSSGNVGFGDTTPDAKLDLELAENTEALRISDTTNTDSVGFFTGNEDPNGTVSATNGSLYIRNDAGNQAVYLNTNGGTAWTDISSGAGSSFLQNGNSFGAAAVLGTNDANSLSFETGGTTATTLSTTGEWDFLNNFLENIGNAGTDFDATGGLTLAGTLTANGQVVLGDNGDTIAFNSSDWDINATGDATGIGAITMDGNFSQTGATTFSTGTGTVSLNGATTVANGSSFTANGAVTLGDNGDTVTIDSSDWNVSATGDLTGIGSTSADGGYTQTGASQNTFSGNVDATSGLDVTGANLTVGGANFSVNQANGNITSAGDLAVNGGDISTTGTTLAITVGNTGTFSFSDGTNTLCTLADAGTTGDLTCTGNATFVNQTLSGDLAVNGGDITSTAPITIDGTGTLTLADNVTQSGAGTFTTGTGLFTASGDATVTGATSLNGNTVIGDAASDTLTITSTILGSTALSFEGATADAFETFFAFTDPTADRTITFPDQSGDVLLGGNDSIDWDDIADAMTLDASTTSSQGANTLTFDLTGSGDFIIADNGSAFVTFADDGSTTFANDIAVNGGDITSSSATLTIDAGSTIAFADDLSWTTATPTLAIANGEVMTITDGTNTLFTLTDAGTTGNLAISGDTTVNGNTTFGNATTDTTTITGATTISSGGNTPLSLTRTSSGQFLGATDGTDTFGVYNRAGSPEGNITANAGSLAIDTTSGALYVKTDDGDNTDWQIFTTSANAWVLGGNSITSNQVLGSTSNFDVQLQRNGTNYLVLNDTAIDVSEDFVPTADNALDLGIATTNRFRTGYFGTSVVVGATTTITDGAITQSTSGTGDLAISTTGGTSGDITLSSFADLFLDSTTTGAVSLGDGNNAKTISIANGTAANTVNIATENTVADTITVGSALDTTNVNGTTTLGGNTTVSNGSSFTANGTVTLGDNGDTVTINSSDWDISATGDMTGIGSFTNDGNLTFGDANTDTITFNAVAASTLDMAANTILNIGNNGTDFSAAGGLTLADDLTVTGNDIIFGNAETISNSTDGVLAFTSPSSTFSGDVTVTGNDIIFGANDYAFSMDTAGVGTMVFNEAGDDTDFRIESDAMENLFFIDASANRIGINTNTPFSELNIVTETQNNEIVLDAYGGLKNVFGGRSAGGTAATPTATQAGDILAEFSGLGYGDTGFAASTTGGMRVVASESFTDSAYGTDLLFRNTPTGSTTLTTRMIIDADGNVGIGDSSPAALLTVGAGDVFQVSSAGAITSTSDLTISGNSILGNNANADTITFNSAVQNIAGSNVLVFEGATANTSETFLAVTDPTADRTITLPDASGTVALLAIDDFDFDDFEDTMDLDATTEINFGNNAYTFDLDGTGDFIIQDNGSTFLTFADDGSTTFGGLLTANGTLALGDGGDTVTINSNDWDISATGDMTGIGAITADGNTVFGNATTDTTTITGATTISSGGNTPLSLTRTSSGQFLGATDGTDTFGVYNRAGSPEGNITADAGSLAIDTTSGALYVKTDDGDNTDWQIFTTSANAWVLGGNSITSNQVLGSTSNFDVQLQRNGTNYLVLNDTAIDVSEDFVPTADNALDLGIATTNRFRTGYFGTSVVVGATTTITDGAITQSTSGTGDLAISTTGGTSGDITLSSFADLFLDSTTTGAVSLGDGNNAKTISIANGTAANTVNIATENTVADTITVGSALDTTNVNGTTTLGGNTTVSNGSSFTANGTVTLGDNGDTVTINSSDWDISATGDMTGIGSFTNDGNLTFGDANTDTITFNAVAASTLDMAANTILNIGNNGTDFSAAGGLTLADDLTVTGNDIIFGNAETISNSTDGVLAFTSPSSTFSGDVTVTGNDIIFGANDYAFSMDTAGVGTMVFNEAGDDTDFRIESDAMENLFFIDASANRIGINTNTPFSELNIVTETQNNEIVLDAYGGLKNVFGGRSAGGTAATPTATQAGDILAEFSGLGYGDTGFAASTTGGMRVVASESFTDSAYGTDLLFRNTPTGSTTLTTRMIIDADGNVGIGDSSPAALLTVGAGDVFQVSSAGAITSTSDLTISGNSILGNNANADTITFNSAVQNIAGSNVLVFEGATANTSETFLAVTDPTADRTITLPDASGTVALLAIDDFDFDDFEDTMDLDATTEINFGNNAYTFDLDGTGDFIIQDNGSTFLTFADDGSTTFGGLLTANGTLALGDGGDTVTINSNDWDISATGDMTGIGAITADGNTVFGNATTDTTTITGATTISSGGNTPLSLTRTSSGQFLGATDGTDTFGVYNRAGSPEGNITADAGSLAIDTTSGALYVKTDDGDNTDWQIFTTSANAWVLGGNSITSNQVLGSTSNFDVQLQRNGTNYLVLNDTAIDVSEDFVPTADNALDLGIATTNRFRTGYFGTSVVVGATTTITDGAITQSTSGTGDLAISTTGGTSGDITLSSFADLFLDSTTTGAVSLGDGNNAKTISIANGTAANTVNIATENTVADTITVGSALDTTNVNGTTTLGGNTTVSNGSSFTANGTVTLGDNGDTVTINSSDWDISATGDMTGIGSFTNDGNLTFGDANTDTITFNAVAASTLDMAANTILNIGNNGTDFSAAGGLTLADDLTVTGNDIIFGNAETISNSTDGVLAFTSPSSTFSGDVTVTGNDIIFGANDYAFSMDTAGVGTMVFNEAGDDTDFRIESDAMENLFFIDASANRIGINTNTPFSELNIVTETQNNEIVLDAYGGLKNVFGGRSAGGTAATPTATQAGDILAEFSGLGYGDTGFAASTTGGMRVVASESFTDSAYGTDLLFRNTPTGSTTLTTRMIIDADGNVGIGDSSPAALLTVGAGDVFQVSSAGAITSTSDLTISGNSILGNNANADTITFNSAVQNIAGSNVLVFEGATANTSETFLAVTDPTADRTITLPDASGTVALLAIDDFDFDDFEDTMDLDATTEINFGNNAYTFDLDGTGDFIIQDNGSTFLTFADDGSTTFGGLLTANGTLALGDGGDTVTINSNDWDISATGDMTGIGAITADGNTVFGNATTDTTTITGATTISSGGNTPLSLTRTSSGQFLGATDGTDTFGVYNRAGSPEGNITADAGSLAIDTTSGALYVKTDDGDNTDWQIFTTSANAWVLGGNSITSNQVLGSTSNFDVQLQRNGTNYLVLNDTAIDVSEDFVPTADNTYDLGIAATNRFRTGYFGTSVLVGATTTITDGAITQSTSGTGDLALSTTGGTSGDITLSSFADLFLDSTTTGAVSLGDGNSAKTISIANGTAANTVNIATDNTVADTITVGSALDTLAITGANFSLATNGNITTAGDVAVNGGDITSSAATLVLNAGGTVDIQDNLTADALTLDTGDLVFENGESITNNTDGTVAVTDGTNNLLTIVDAGTVGNVTATGSFTANGAGDFDTTLNIDGALTANGTFTLGDNGDTGIINTSDWDIGATGDMTGIGAITADGNITQTGATTLSTGTGAISLNGATSVTGTNTFTVGTGTTTLGGTLDANGQADIGDGGDTVSIDSSDWDISTTGAMTGIGAITMDGLLTGTAGATLSGAAISLNANSNFATNIGTGTSTGAVAIGGGANTLAIDTTSWDVSSAGVASGLTGLTTTGNVTLSGAEIQGASPLVFEGATVDGNEITLAVTDPGADFTLTLPAETGTLISTVSGVVQNGNSFGTTMTIGTNDAQSLALETNGATQFTIPSGAATLTGTGATSLVGGTTLSLTSNTTNAVTLDSGTTGTVNLGTGNNAKTINLGTGTAGNTVNIANNATTADTIAIGGQATDALTITGAVTINNNTNATVTINSGTSTGAVGIAAGTGAQTLNLATGNGAKTINLGTGTVANTIAIGGTGANTITLGNTQTAGSISLGAAMTTGTISIGGTGAQTGTISLGTGTGAQTINLATGAGAKTTTLGSTNTTSATTVQSGTGGLTLTSTTTGNASLDSGTTGTVNLGVGNNAKTINLGTGTAGNTINIGTNNTTADTIGIGSALDLLTISGFIQGASPFIFEGATANASETTFAITDPTSDNTITFPDSTGTVIVTGANQTLSDNTSIAFLLAESTNQYFRINTTNASEALTFGNGTTNPSFSFAGSGTTTFTGDIAVNGDDITSDGATLTINASGTVDIQDNVVADQISLDNATTACGVLFVDSSGVVSQDTDDICFASAQNKLGLGGVPTYQLHIYKEDNPNVAALQLASSTGNAGGNKNVYGGVFSRGSEAAPSAVQANDILLEVGGLGYGDTAFASSTTAGLRMIAESTFTDANHNSQIQFLVTPSGSTIQSTGLILRGSGQLQARDGTAAEPIFSFQGDTDTGMFWNSGNSIGFSTGGTERLTIDSNGNSLFSTAGVVGSPSISFSGDTNMGIYRSAADELSISTAGTQRMVVDSNGDVGIGEAAPSSRLSVVGTAAEALGDVARFSNLNTAAGNTNTVLELRTGANATGACTAGAGNTNCSRYIQFFEAATTDNDGTAAGRIAQLGATGVSYATGAADFGEYMLLDAASSTGDIVGFGGGVKRVAQAGDVLLGVVSESTGFLGNGNLEGTPNATVVGFLGIVSTTVNDENGAIAEGDPITVSSTNGEGMKQTESGYTVGYALDSLPSGTGTIDIFVAPKYTDVAVLAGGGGGTGTSGWFDRAGTVITTATAGDDLTIDGTMTMNGDVVLGSNSSDTLTFNGSLASGLDLGNNLLTNIGNPGTDFTAGGGLTLAGDLTITGNDVIFGNGESIANTTDGTIAFTDGTNTLLSIIDQGTYGTLRLSDKGSTGDPATCTAGEIYFNDTDNQVKACISTNTWVSLTDASGIAADSLNYTDFSDSLALDGTTTTAHGAFNNIFNLDSTGDFIIQDNGVASVTFADDGSTTLAGLLTANGTVALGDNGDTVAINSNDWDISTTGDMTGIGSIALNGNFTQTGATTFGTGTGAVSLNGATSITGSNTFTVGTGTTALGGLLNVTGNQTNTGDLAVNGGDITSTATTLNVAVGNTGTINFTDGTNTLLSIADAGTSGNLTVSNNGTFTGDLAVNGADITSTGATLRINAAGTLDVQDILNADSLTLDTGDITLRNTETIANSTDDLIVFGGAGGTNNVSLTLDLDGASASVPTFSSSANDLVAINDSLTIGIDGATTENIALTDFALSGGNDLYVEDKLGVNGNASIDGELITTTFSGSGLTDCDSATSILLWDSTTKTFSCGVDNDRVQLAAWADANMGSSLSNSQLDRPTSQVLPGATSELQVPFAGDVVYMSVAGSSARSAGTATFEVYINDVASGFTCVIDATNTQYNDCSNSGDTFVAGDTVDVRVDTTGAWSPTNAEWTVVLYAQVTTGADLAELYNVEDTSIEAGDVVAVHPDVVDGMQKSATPYDDTVLGVISTKPGSVLGTEDVIDLGMSRAVALSGRVPVKVSTINGDIEPGDYLTTSSIPGVAMKATRGGAIIGTALTGFDALDENEIGTVTLFIKNGYANGSEYEGSTIPPALNEPLELTDLDLDGISGIIATDPIEGDVVGWARGVFTAINETLADIAENIDSLFNRIDTLEQTVEEQDALIQDLKSRLDALDGGATAGAEGGEGDDNTTEDNGENTGGDTGGGDTGDGSTDSPQDTGEGDTGGADGDTGDTGEGDTGGSSGDDGSTDLPQDTEEGDTGSGDNGDTGGESSGDTGGDSGSGDAGGESGDTGGTDAGGGDTGGAI